MSAEHEREVGERLAILETETKGQSRDIEKILDGIDNIRKSLADKEVKYEARLSRMETRLKVYTGIAVALVPIIAAAVHFF